MKISVRDLNTAIERIRRSGKRELANFLNDKYLLPAVERKDSDVIISDRNIEILGIGPEIKKEESAVKV